MTERDVLQLVLSNLFKKRQVERQIQSISVLCLWIMVVTLVPGMFDVIENGYRWIHPFAYVLYLFSGWLNLGAFFRTRRNVNRITGSINLLQTYLETERGEEDQLAAVLNEAVTV